MTLETIRFNNDLASKYSYNKTGYTFLRTIKPRTKACILRNLGRVNFIIICFVLLSLATIYDVFYVFLYGLGNTLLSLLL